ncbi:MAG: hypothetical protein ACREP9_15800 [Candidatus Dormibacteraceae bacterium]
MHNGYGWEYNGVSPSFEGELRARISVVSSRSTQADARDLLPPLLVGCRFVDPRERLSAGADFAVGSFAEGASKVCLLVHHREAAHTLADLLNQADELADAERLLITGEMSHGDRVAAIEQARKADKAIVIATLHSVNVAIDMAFFPVVCLVEAYARPADIIQVLGRFPRLGG